MAVKRQKNWLGQQRVDIPHLREVESAVVADFDDLAGKVLASGRPIVVSGMTIAMGAAVGGFATALVLNTASSILLHGTASEAGAVFVVPSTQPADTLTSSNPNVSGSFTPNAFNYIGIDLIRLVDDSTADTTKFRAATTKKEFAQDVPQARTLQYRIIISPDDFSLQPNVAPVAKVQLDASGVVTSVTDCRELMFRLGSGGSVPNPQAVYAWPGGRVENPVTSTSTTDPFAGADKSIGSFIDFFNAMESRLWEVGGGEHWYSQTTDRDVFFIRDPASLFAGGENFEWTGTNLHWQGLRYVFGNSTATSNAINDQLVDSPGLTDLAVGECLYVDLDRAANSALTAVKVSLTSVGVPAVPGSRHIIAWRTTEGVFGLGSSNPVGFALPHASTSAFGVVKLASAYVPDAANPVVPVVDAAAQVVATGITRATAGTLSIGTGANDDAVIIATAGVQTDIDGSLSVAELLEALGGIRTDSIENAGAAGGALDIGTTAQTGTVNIGRTGQTVAVAGNETVAGTLGVTGNLSAPNFWTTTVLATTATLAVAAPAATLFSFAAVAGTYEVEILVPYFISAGTGGTGRISFTGAAIGAGGINGYTVGPPAGGSNVNQDDGVNRVSFVVVAGATAAFVTLKALLRCTSSGTVSITGEHTANTGGNLSYLGTDTAAAGSCTLKYRKVA